jgi:hypothetical protein
MAHFVKLENNIVVQGVVVHNNELLVNSVESEQAGIDFLNNLYGTNDTWIQTSYNRTFRKNFAGLGDTYDPTKDAFIPRKPFDSWVLNETTCSWDAPTPYPTDGKMYVWDEPSLTWIIVESSTQTPVVHL